MTTQHTPLTREQEIGKAVVELLAIRTAPGFTDRYDTTWGTKTLQGLGTSIRRIVNGR